MVEVQLPIIYFAKAHLILRTFSTLYFWVEELGNSQRSPYLPQIHNHRLSTDLRSQGSIKADKIELWNRQPTMQLKSLIYLGSAFTLVFGATTQDVLNDINTLRTRLNTLDSDLHSFSGGILDALVSFPFWWENMYLIKRLLGHP